MFRLGRGSTLLSAAACDQNNDYDGPSQVTFAPAGPYSEGPPPDG